MVSFPSVINITSDHREFLIITDFPFVLQIILSQEPDPEETSQAFTAKHMPNGDGFKYISETRIVPRR